MIAVCAADRLPCQFNAGFGSRNARDDRCGIVQHGHRRCLRRFVQHHRERRDVVLRQRRVERIALPHRGKPVGRLARVVKVRPAFPADRNLVRLRRAVQIDRQRLRKLLQQVVQPGLDVRRVFGLLRRYNRRDAGRLRLLRGLRIVHRDGDDVRPFGFRLRHRRLGLDFSLGFGLLRQCALHIVRFFYHDFLRLRPRHRHHTEISGHRQCERETQHPFFHACSFPVHGGTPQFALFYHKPRKNTNFEQIAQKPLVISLLCINLPFF